MIVYLVALSCVVGIAAGQLLFKLSSAGLSKTGTILATESLGPLLCAMLLYLATSVGWVWALQRTDLGRLYPLMALAFALVPAGSYYLFGERFQPQYFVGIALIITGIVVSTYS